MSCRYPLQTDFCRFCGANIPPKLGEGSCDICDPDGVRANIERNRALEKTTNRKPNQD